MAEDGNDFLNPDEIEALLNAAKDQPDELSDIPDPTEPTETSPDPNPAGGEFLDPSDVDALLQQRDAGDQASNRGIPNDPFGETDPDQVLDRAQAQLGRAMAGSIQMPDPTAKFGPPSAFAFEQFDGGHHPTRDKQPLEILQDVELDLRIELGRTEMLIEEVVGLKEGSVVTLDKLAGDPVDILVNGRLIARGEVLVLNDNFCVRVAEILTPHA